MDLNPVNQKGERNIWCEHYDECLDTAATNRWKGFDCSLCKHRSNKAMRTQVLLRNKNQDDAHSLVFSYVRT